MARSNICDTWLWAQAPCQPELRKRQTLNPSSPLTSTHTPLLQKSAPNVTLKLEISPKPQLEWAGNTFWADSSSLGSYSTIPESVDGNCRENKPSAQRTENMRSPKGLQDPRLLEKFRGYLWDLYCGDPWRGSSGQWTQPSQPCLSQTGAAPQARAAPAPSAPSHGCTWTTDGGKETTPSLVSSYTCPFLAPGIATHFFSAKTSWVYEFILQLRQLLGKEGRDRRKKHHLPASLLYTSWCENTSLWIRKKGLTWKKQ